MLLYSLFVFFTLIKLSCWHRVVSSNNGDFNLLPKSFKRSLFLPIEEAISSWPLEFVITSSAPRTKFGLFL
jgi:hypothetical protein